MTRYVTTMLRLWLTPSGNLTGVYRKQHLVPFGEYVPLRRALFFVSPLVETVGDFSPGPGPEVLPFEGYKIGTAICYEVIYPEACSGLCGARKSLTHYCDQRCVVWADSRTVSAFSTGDDACNRTRSIHGSCSQYRD